MIAPRLQQALANGATEVFFARSTDPNGRR